MSAYYCPDCEAMIPGAEVSMAYHYPSNTDRPAHDGPEVEHEVFGDAPTVHWVDEHE